VSIEYIRKTYGLQIKVGQQVSIRNGAGTWFDGLVGKVLRARGQYVVVKGETWRGNFHPADVEPTPATTTSSSGGENG
jgi:hypothetical protein